MKFKIFQPLLGVASRVLLLGLALLSPWNLYRRVCLSAASQALLFLTGDVAGFRHKRDPSSAQPRPRQVVLVHPIEIVDFITDA